VEEIGLKLTLRTAKKSADRRLIEKMLHEARMAGLVTLRRSTERTGQGRLWAVRYVCNLLWIAVIHCGGKLLGTISAKRPIDPRILKSAG